MTLVETANGDWRLFVAIEFDEELKDRLARIVEILHPLTSRGSFTHRENLHLTMVFLGNIPATDVPKVKAAIDGIQGEPLPLTISGLGRFRRPDGDICWLGVEDNPSLYQLHVKLRDALVYQGFSVESRPFKPHLTLGRRVQMKLDLDYQQLSARVAPLQVRVEHLTLMHSHRVNNRLTYTPIYRKRLGKI